VLHELLEIAVGQTVAEGDLAVLDACDSLVLYFQCLTLFLGVRVEILCSQD